MRLFIRVTSLCLLLMILACFGPDHEGQLSPPAGFILVPAGSFRMGEPADLVDPIPGTRRVSLSRSFILARHELALAEYLPALNHQWRQGTVVLDDGWLYDSETGMPLLDLSAGRQIVYADPPFDAFALVPGAEQGWPVAHLSWYGAALYCDWRNEAEGLPASYLRDGYDWTCGPDGNPYAAAGWRLPAEAEWEYAARFPDHRQYPWGDAQPDCGWVNGRVSPDEDPCETTWLNVGNTSPAGDSWHGFADMAGNVAEWCQDWHSEWESYEDLRDPVDVDVLFHFDKCLRGGAYSGFFEELSAWHRGRQIPEEASEGSGLRLARSWGF